MKSLTVLVAALAMTACSRSNPNFSSGDLAPADLRGADLAGVEEDLAGADLTGVEQDLADVDLTDVDLAGADLTTPAYKLTVSNAMVMEGDDGVVALRFHVTLTPYAPYNVSFDYATSDGTAQVASGDYLAVQGRISLESGYPFLDIDVPVIGDLYDEAPETVMFTISNASGAVIQTATGTGTIQDDDDAPTISIDDSGAYEGAATGAIFRVSLDAPSGRTITVPYTTAAGTADANDFTAAAGTVTFMPGETEKTITIAVTDDGVMEAPEDFTVTLTAPAGTVAGTLVATGTIYDNDSGDLPLSASLAMIAEGDAGTTQLVFTYAVPATLVLGGSFHIKTIPITATEGVDYDGIDADYSILPVGSSVQVVVTVHGDAVSEANETFALLATDPTGLTIQTPLVVGRINDDDAVPSITLSPTSTNERDVGARLQAIPITISDAAERELSFTVATMSGTAMSPGDFASTSGFVRIPPGRTTWSMGVPFNGDLVNEPDETYSVLATLPINATIAASPITCTVKNDD